jgi:hypothetical protein
MTRNNLLTLTTCALAFATLGLAGTPAMADTGTCDPHWSQLGHPGYGTCLIWCYNDTTHQGSHVTFRQGVSQAYCNALVPNYENQLFGS